MPARNPYRLALAVLVAAALPSGIAAAATPNPAPAPPAASAPCGDATLATVSSVVANVATNIYRGELAGQEVAIDQRHVLGSAALLKAVATHNSLGVYSALRALVYHPLWHIVRLRVLDPKGHVLGDVGGPYIIAPVAALLRLDGRVIGSYLMSVQDDYGFTLLESHAAGDPIAIYYHGKKVADMGGPLPPKAPVGSTLTLSGVTYAVLTLTYNAFPTGTLTAVILVPPPAPSLAAQPCPVVRALEIGHVAKLLAERFHPLDLSYAKYAEVVHSDTGATVILRIGPRAIPGSQGIGPAVIPDSGPLTYLGHSYWVVSFAPTPPARIYLLVSVLSTPAPTT